MRKIALSKGTLLALFLSIIVSASSLNAAVQQLSGVPYITNYNAVEYGASQQNWSAVQDQRGVMYFANTNGLLVFYGNHWECIMLPNESVVRALEKSHTGRIYAGGIDEFGVITTDSTGQLQYVSLVYLLKQSKPIGNVREIA
ncbi:MAG: hypothetical protein GY757_52155, partial [bacterium]|nr:hypothetical protein [bacterium]